MLSADEKRKYLRQIILPEIGVKGQEKIRSASVAVIGCGGIGCPVALYLASAGVGKIGLIDFDTVHITNLHRQILFGEGDVGVKKIEVARKKILALHPSATITVHDLMLNESNAADVLCGYDLVIDGSDNFATRYIVNDTCVTLGKTLVYASILGFEGQLAVFNHNGSRNLRDLFPVQPDPAEVPDCSENGVLATVPGILGIMAANECIKLLIGKGDPGNKLNIVNCGDNGLSVVNF